MNKKSIFISVFEMAEKGELTSTEQSQVMNALITYGCGLKPEEVSQVFKNIRLGTRHLLEQTEKSLDFALDSVNEFHKKFEGIVTKEKSLPNGATLGDDAITIKFINSLTKDVYNISEAEKLIGISRQTITRHAKNGKYSLKTTKISKTDYITREILILYYRDYKKKDGYGF
jgi:hypothetical protein